tara:strand:+ start:599 stop:892 length:294 start_codon:yes stop_codon:yes gene_type:complete
MNKIINDRIRNIYEDIQDKTIVQDLKKQIYLHEVKYLEMLGIDVDSLTEEMDSIVENRVEFLDMVEQYVAIMTDRKLIDSQSKKSKKTKSETKNRWA